MSRLFCPSSRSIPATAQSEFVDGRSSAVLHATSVFDCVVRRHDRNAYTRLKKSCTSPQHIAHQSVRRLSPIRRRSSSALTATIESPERCHDATQNERASTSMAMASALPPVPNVALAHSNDMEQHSLPVVTAAPPPAAITFGEHVTFALTQQSANSDTSSLHSAASPHPPPLLHQTSSSSLLAPLQSQQSFHSAAAPYSPNKYYSSTDAALSRCTSIVAPVFDDLYFPHNRVRPRNYLNTTLKFADEYTEERKRFESRTDVEMQLELCAESAFWRANISDITVGRSNSPIRPGDAIAQKIENNKKLANSKFLTKVRQYMAQVEVLMEQQNEASRKAADAAAAERKRMSEWASANPFSAGGVLDKTFTNIAKDVVSPKFSSLANRYYNIAYRNRQIDIDLKEAFVVKLEHSVFRLQSIMSYNEFAVVFRQFNRYTAPNTYLTIAQIPKNGWVFVDKVIKTLITRKIDKNKSGKIHLPDLIKHLFPAMTMPEITVAIAAYEEQYLKFIDKKVYLFLDTIDPDKVNHFGVVFSIVDKLGNGRVSRQEFVYNMPIDRDASNDELEEIQHFLGELFDHNARRDMNEKLELVGEPYLDLDNMAIALSISRYNVYGGTIM